MSSYLLINPLSGSYSRALHDEILASLQGVGVSVASHTVTGPDDARRVCAEIEAEAERPLVIVAGGDGTVNAVVNGLSPGRSTLAVLPVGTANVLALEVGIASVDDGIRRIAAGNTKPLTAGTIITTDGQVRRFLLMAGIGLDGEIVRRVQLKEKRLLGKGAYLLSALRCLGDWPRERFILRVDGREVACHSAIVSNISRYGGSTVLLPGGDLSDPHLDIFCITATSRRAYLRIIADALAGRPCRDDQVTLLRGAEIEVAGERAIQLDGDYYGTAPVRIWVDPEFARIVV